MPTKIRLKRTLAPYKDTTSPPFLRCGYHHSLEAEGVEDECLFSAKKRGGAVGDFLRPRTRILGLRARMIGVRYVDDKSTCVDRGIVAVLREKIHSRGELPL